MQNSMPSRPAQLKPKGLMGVQDGVNGIPHPQETQEGGLDQKRSMVGPTRVAICITAVILTRTVLISRKMTVQVSPLHRKGKQRCKLCADFLLFVEESVPQALAQALEELCQQLQFLKSQVK
jgi:hypothetical protein